MKVAIFGGGVAGLSAAHELIKRGFEVEIYEASAVAGGKARSMGVPGSGKDGRMDLPGEHGFRFFPRFYKHIVDTFKEIPLTGKKGTVYDNLTETSRICLARFDKESVFLPARFPRSLQEFEKIINESLDLNLGLSADDKKMFALKVWQLMTSCYDRRQNEYERLPWWEFMDADGHSLAYQTIFVKGLTRTLVAARAECASTKTGGDIFVQLLFDVARPGTSSDRILNAPTNEAWIDPWVAHLKKKGVKFIFNSPLKNFNCDNRKITSATVTQNNTDKNILADYYLGAVPVEVMAKVLTHDVMKLDPTLKNIQTLSTEVSWMNGTQFYLKKDVEITHGHAIYIDSPWAITSISQKQFWPGVDLSKYGDGKVKGILSIDVSDWDTPGDKIKKTAKECTKQEVIEEVWHQLKRSLNVDGKVVIEDADLHDWFIDPGIIFNIPISNNEPLLVNTVNSWDLRPFSYTTIPNLFLASDYVKTFTDLATMEGANEAARRAVNGILDASGSRKKKCTIWKLHEPWFLILFRWIDKRRYKQGLVWNSKFPWIFRVMQSVVAFVKNLFKI